jgi:hypothetical protein
MLMHAVSLDEGQLTLVMIAAEVVAPEHRAKFMSDCASAITLIDTDDPGALVERLRLSYLALDACSGCGC